MTKQDAEQIIDTINQLSTTANNIICNDKISGEQIFQKIKHYLGHYYCADNAQNTVLNHTNLSHCRQYIKSSQYGYYTAIEFYDIDADSIQELAETLDNSDCCKEAELVWGVVNFVKEIQSWASYQSREVIDVPYNTIPRKLSVRQEVISEDDFIMLFDTKQITEYRIRLLFSHIQDVSHEKSVHTYYGALAQECTNWFKYQERDFTNIVKKFLIVAGLDPKLASNVRKTKLGDKKVQRAKEMIKEISSSRSRK